MGQARRAARLQGLADRHLKLKPVTAPQFDSLKNLPERPPSFANPAEPDPIAAMIDTIDPDIDHRLAAGAGGRRSDRSGRTPQQRARASRWRRRLIRGLLYGRNVDRAAKARARVGFAMLAFAAIYARDRRPSGHCSRWSATATARAAPASQDAVATARPDILDRNGEVLATDVKTPSLFAEPRRIIDKDEAIELLTAVLPDLDTAEVRERLGSQQAASSGSSARSRRSSSRRSTGSAFPASASCPRTSASIRTAPTVVAPDRPRQHRQPGHRRHREVARQQRAGRSASRRLRHRPAAEAGRALGRSARRSTRCATNC